MRDVIPEFKELLLAASRAGIKVSDREATVSWFKEKAHWNQDDANTLYGRVLLGERPPSIETVPGICGGQPKIAGHRITVKNIAIWHVRMGKSIEEIANDYALNVLDVYDALVYYFNHRLEIDRQIEEDNEFVEKLKKTTPSLLKRKLREKRRGRAS